MTTSRPKQLVWVGSSLNDLRAFPEEVRQVMGFALFEAQMGGKHVAAKPLRGFKGAGVLEDAVYVLHAFEKKSKKGISTPRRNIDLVQDRLKMAQQIHDARHGATKGKRT